MMCRGRVLAPSGAKGNRQQRHFHSERLINQRHACPRPDQEEEEGGETDTDGY